MRDMAEEGFLFLACLDRFPQRLCHLFDLFLIVHLFGGVHKGQDQPLQFLRHIDAGRSSLRRIHRILCLALSHHTIRCNADHIGLTRNRSAVLFHGNHGF